MHKWLHAPRIKLAVKSYLTRLKFRHLIPHKTGYQPTQGNQRLHKRPHKFNHFFVLFSIYPNRRLGHANYLSNAVSLSAATVYRPYGLAFLSEWHLLSTCEREQFPIYAFSTHKNLSHSRIYRVYFCTSCVYKIQMRFHVRIFHFFFVLISSCWLSAL